MFRKSNRWNILQCILSTAEQFLMIFLMYQISQITDTVVEGNAEGFVRQLPILGITLCLEIILFYAAKLVVIQIRVFCGYELRDRVYRKILFDESESREENRKANIFNVYNSQIEQLANLAPRNGEIGVAVLTLIVAIFYMCTVNIKLLIVSMIFVPAAGHAYDRLMIPMQRKNREIMGEKKEINQIIKENLDGFYIVDAFGLSDFFLKKFESCSETIRKIESEKDRIASVLGRVGILLRYMPQLIVPLYGGWLTYTGEMSVGELVAVNTVIWYVILPIEKLLDIRKRRKEQKPVIENVTGMLEDEEKERDADFVNDGSFQILEVENLNFGYSDGSNVLRDVNLSIKKGEHILLLGKSGIGKSTLAKILCGLETGYEGKVKINGVEVAKGNVGDIRKRIMYIPQNPYIFAGSIVDNICMGHRATEKEIKQASELAGVAQFVEKFSDGYDTIVGEGGVQLSGGQRKRIAVARAIIAGGELYILDEPTASLDTGGGEELMKNLAGFWSDKAMLIISHSTRDMPKMDAVYTVQEGMLSHE